jgi:lysophospholipid acyltransferase (LPLAT)-like uncharacterized protein
MKKFLDELILFLVPIIGAFLVFLLGKSWRIKWVGKENILAIRKKNQKVIYAFWHGRMLALSFSHRWQKVHVLISQHRDGEFISRIISLLGFASVRGSTTRGGSKAIFQMANKNLEDCDVAVTPDGPKGPKYIAQSGAIYIAQRSGMPIIPISDSAEKRWTLKSWDEFIIPKPFSKVIIILGEPIYVDVQATPEKIELKRKELEEKLVSLTLQADNFFQNDLFHL